MLIRLLLVKPAFPRVTHWQNTVACAGRTDRPTFTRTAPTTHARNFPQRIFAGEVFDGMLIPLEQHARKLSLRATAGIAHPREQRLLPFDEGTRNTDLRTVAGRCALFHILADKVCGQHLGGCGLFFYAGDKHENEVSAFRDGVARRGNE